MMTLDALREGIAERYQVAPDFPWRHLPDACVFRHADNRKWFCLYMRVPAQALGRQGGEHLPVVNVKVPPELVGAACAMAGIMPAYHMNREHWVSLLLQEADADMLWQLLDGSFHLTHTSARLQRTRAHTTP